MRPSLALEANREAVRALVARRRVENPRVFGSVARGEDEEGSDLDLLVDALPGATLLDLCGLQIDLEDLLGFKVDVVTPEELPRRIKGAVLAEARAL